MDVSANSHRAAHRLNVGLVNEDFLGLVAEKLDLMFRNRLELGQHVDLFVQNRYVIDAEHYDWVRHFEHT